MDRRNYQDVEHKELWNMELYMERELQQELQIFKRNMERYQKMPLETRKKQAQKSLILSGVLNEDGTKKSVIVTR